MLEGKGREGRGREGKGREGFKDRILVIIGFSHDDGFGCSVQIK